MVRKIALMAVACLLLVISGCGGGSGSSEKGGPLAGTWIGSAKGVMYTIKISGPGNSYSSSWKTSNNCFTSTSGSAVHFNDDVSILGSGYDAGEDQYVIPDIIGEYDGANTISGTLHAITCGVPERTPIVLTR